MGRGKFGPAQNRACRSVEEIYSMDCHKEKDVRVTDGPGVTNITLSSTVNFLVIYHNDSAATQTESIDAVRRGFGLWHL